MVVLQESAGCLLSLSSDVVQSFYDYVNSIRGPMIGDRWDRIRSIMPEAIQYLFSFNTYRQKKCTIIYFGTTSFYIKDIIIIRNDHSHISQPWGRVWKDL